MRFCSFLFTLATILAWSGSASAQIRSSTIGGGGGFSGSSGGGFNSSGNTFSGGSGGSFSGGGGSFSGGGGFSGSSGGGGFTGAGGVTGGGGGLTGGVGGSTLNTANPLYRYFGNPLVNGLPTATSSTSSSYLRTFPETLSFGNPLYPNLTTSTSGRSGVSGSIGSNGTATITTNAFGGCGRQRIGDRSTGV